MKHATARYSVCTAAALAFVAGHAHAQSAEPATKLPPIAVEVPKETDEPGVALPLDGAPAAPAPRTTGPAVAAPATPQLVDNDVAKKPVPDETPSGDGQRTAGYIIGGVGVAALGMGSFFGLRAISKWSERKDNCAGGCTEIAKDAGDDAKSAALISDIGFGVGLIAVGVGSYLILSAKSSPETSASPRPASEQARSWQFVPALSSTGGGLVLRADY